MLKQKIIGLALALPTVLAGCSSLNISDIYDEVSAKDTLAGPQAYDIRTPLAEPLECVGAKVKEKRSNTTFAVGKVDDFTGMSQDASRPVMTRGAALMLISSLDRLGVKQVERLDTSVPEMELKYANQKLLGDETGQEPYKQILAGVFHPSDYVIVGGVTELDFNAYSGAKDFRIGPVGRAERLYAITVGIDLRLVETESLKVVDTVSYKKQIFGRESQNGFTFFTYSLGFDASNRERVQEPIQTSVRLVLERAAIDLIGGYYKIDTATCLPTDTDQTPVETAI